MMRGMYLTIALLASSISGSLADDVYQLQEKGFRVLWQGYASIPTCKPNDSYRLGKYLFVCDKYTYDYPYHYGTVYLASITVTLRGQTMNLSYLCLEEGECIAGSIYLPQ